MENITIKLSIIVSIGLVYFGWMIWEFIHPSLDEFEKEHEEAVDFRDNTENPEKN